MTNPKRRQESAPLSFPRATRQEKTEQRRELVELKARLEAATSAAPLTYDVPRRTPDPERQAGSTRRVPRIETYSAEHRARVWEDLDRMKKYDRGSYERSYAYHHQLVVAEQETNGNTGTTGDT